MTWRLVRLLVSVLALELSMAARPAWSSPLRSHDQDLVDLLDDDPQGVRVDLGHARPWPGLAVDHSWVRTEVDGPFGLRTGLDVAGTRAGAVQQRRAGSRLVIARRVELRVAVVRTAVAALPATSTREATLAFQHAFGAWHVRAGIDAQRFRTLTADTRSQRWVELGRRGRALDLGAELRESPYGRAPLWALLGSLRTSDGTRCGVVLRSEAGRCFFVWSAWSPQIRLWVDLSGAGTGGFELGLRWTR